MALASTDQDAAHARAEPDTPAVPTAGATDDLPLPEPPDATAEQLVLLAEIRAQWQRVRQRQIWSCGVVRELLLGAARAGAKDVEKGRALFVRAETIFDEDVQTLNRLVYLAGIVSGIAFIILLVGAIARFQLAWPDISHNLTDAATLVSLFTFAGLGSLTSVLTRLSTIDLSHEVRKKYVFWTAATRPLVAVSFASVVYVLLHNEIIPLHLDNKTDNGQAALIWIAAFLCGFSERFATDFLGRIDPLGTAEKVEATAPAGPRRP